MALGDGRNQVIDDTVLDPDWGNAVADRTVQSYPDVATRDGQWVTPQAGAVAYTAADDNFWMRQGVGGGKWVLLGMGTLAYADGPAKNIDSASGKNSIGLALTFAAKVRHRYLWVAYAGVNVITAPGLVNVITRDDAGVAYLMFKTPDNTLSIPGGSGFGAGVTGVYVATANKNATLTISGSINGGSANPKAVLRFLAGLSHLTVVDVGGG